MIKIRKVASAICMIFIIIVICYLTYYKFANPDMTSTRILLNTWPAYVALISVALGWGILKK